MANLYYGTAVLHGDNEVLKRMAALLDNLETVSEESGFDGSEDWLPHIFTERLSDEGIFYNSHEFTSDGLSIRVMTTSTDGIEFFRRMAAGLAMTIDYSVVDEVGEWHHEHHFTPYATGEVWALREVKSEQPAVSDIVDEVVQTARSCGIVVTRDMAITAIRKEMPSIVSNLM